MAAHTSTAAEIRKLRKKLRQIENLERLARSLDESETVKVSKKYNIREQLQELLSQDQSNQSSKDQPQSAQTFDPMSPESMGEEEEVEMGEPVSRGEDASFESPSAAGHVTSSSNKGEEGDMLEKLKLSAAEPNVAKPQQMAQSKPNKPPNAQPSKSSEGAKNVDSLTEERRHWKQQSVLVSELDGHNDLVTSVSIQGTSLVSASRDTTVKVWNLLTGEEIHSLGGHTETVTSVLILSPEETAGLSEEDTDQSDSFIVSGSTDCTLKIWSLATGRAHLRLINFWAGKEVKSVYTFNPVTCLDYVYSAHLLVTASDGGKIELWNLKTAENVCTVRAHEEAVTAIKVQRNTVISSGADGLIMVHEVRGGSLMRIFVSEEVRLASGSGRVHQRRVRSLTAAGHMVVFGDDAVNIKVLDWKKGLVTKLVNHVSEFASADAVYLWDDLLLSSSFDLDNGTGYINVRCFSSGEYLATLDDEEVEGTDRIVCLAATQLPSGTRLVVSGGPQLKLWELLPPGQRSPPTTGDQEKWVIATQFRPDLSRPAQDSEAESEAEDSEDYDDDEDDEGGEDEMNEEDEEKLGWSCSIV